jgi:hypothetical protein
MPSTLTRSLALRAGCSAGHSKIDPDHPDDDGRTAGACCRASMPLEGDGNALDLDALLTLAEGAGTKTGDATLSALEEALERDPPAPEEIRDLLPERLAAAHAFAREPRSNPHAGRGTSLTVVCVRKQRYYAAQARGMPAYLLREGTLLPLSPDHPPRRFAADEEGTELEPEVASGRLQDGDALLVCSRSLHEVLGAEDVVRILLHATGPETAATRLVADAARRGAPGAAASVLFAGVGPALAARLRSTMAPADPSAWPADDLTAARPGRKPQGIGLVAATAALAGVMLGIGAGVWLALSLSGAWRPQQAGGELPAPPAITPLSPPISVPSEPFRPTPPAPELNGLAADAPAANAPAPASNAPAQAAANGPDAPAAPPAAANGPVSTAPSPVIPASLTGPQRPPLSPPVRVGASVPQPVLIQAPPPPHNLAQGFVGGAHFSLRLNPQRSTIDLQASQGVIYMTGSPLGTPVGEALSFPVSIFLRDRPQGADTELRLTSNGIPVAALGEESVRKLMGGEHVSLPPVRPGSYELMWWSARTGPLPAIVSLRLAASAEGNGETRK